MLPSLRRRVEIRRRGQPAHVGETDLAIADEDLEAADAEQRVRFAWRHLGRMLRGPPGGCTAFDLGYTQGMKTAVSVPDDVFERVERLARRERRSRSEVYSAALREYVARHAPDEVTEALNRVVAEGGEAEEPFVVAAGRRIPESAEW